MIGGVTSDSDYIFFLGCVPRGVIQCAAVYNMEETLKLLCEQPVNVAVLPIM